MTETAQESLNEAAAFQKIWLETLAKMAQVSAAYSPGFPATEILRQLRAGMLRALGEAWEEYLRSPQFTDGKRQWLDQAIDLRKLRNDHMARIRSEIQSPHRGDIDSMMLAVRHLEQRLLGRVDELSGVIEQLDKRASQCAAGGAFVDGAKGFAAANRVCC
jgi:hypothetical protein